ncbi:MAG TPA: alpha-hydroxy acid oxidase [Steroidobacteraceae bacterium]|nr:alpha-hydroxy acid oxidase [Steroidobacteraceae bacterium]
MKTRREVLLSLAAAPAAAMLAPALRAGGTGDGLIESPEQALDVFDFERLARAKLPPAHYGYLATGVDGDATLAANEAGFRRWSLRVRRLAGVAKPDTSVKLFDRAWPSPIVINPLGSQRAFHPDGELATARAAATRDVLQVLSTVSSTGVEDVSAARGEPVWYQLYPTDQWAVTEALVRRAEAAGCPALALTVDLAGGSNRVTMVRWQRRDDRDCGSCHSSIRTQVSGFIAGKPMFKGLDLSAVGGLSPADMDWAFFDRLRGLWKRKLFIKGIVTREDAELAVAHGVDGLFVSNHGGRGEDSGRASIESLPEVAAGVRGRVPVILDGGIRRGSDVFKALALGANAVGIGRPYAWGLASFGQAGVERVIDLLRAELAVNMRQAGTASIADIDASYLADSRAG